MALVRYLSYSVIQQMTSQKSPMQKVEPHGETGVQSVGVLIIFFNHGLLL